MAGIAPDDVIASRRWDLALFTTYALSLTFFESVVLRRLREKGCREIWLIADAEGYRSSLMERRSSRVGQEYRLIPVGLPRGVFHPKCSYLAGPEGDLLLIGSGNLTFGGYGRNLEVLEVLEPSSSPAAFEDFARFLNALREREDFITPDRSWASTFATQARGAVRASVGQPNQEQPRLIHTVESPAIEQIAEVCTANGGGQQLVVLSPFHDPDGSAVQALAGRTGCSTIAVGLSPDEYAPSPFPFAKAKGWGNALRAVRPELSDDIRGLHAKWFEVALPEAKLTVTGSINATTKSLCTTDNVEVAVLRLEPPSVDHARWKTVATPRDFVAPKYRAAGMGQGCLVHASLLGDGTLAGRLLSTFEPSGTWAGMLVLHHGEHVEFSVTASSTGDFKTPLPRAERFAFASALQIELKQGERIARGWVHLDELLRMPRLQGLGVASLLRLINREETEDDDIALLDYFAMSSSRHLTTFARPIKLTKQHQGGTRDDDESDVIVELDELAPDPDFPSLPGGSSPRDSNSVEEAALSRVLAQLRKRLISQPAQRGALLADRATSTFDAEFEEGEEDSNDVSRRRLNSAWEYFDEQMRVMASQAENEAARRVAFVIWFEVSMHMLLRRLKDRERAVGFLRSWFYEACAEPRQTEEAGALEQHVFTVAALVPLLAGADVERSTLRTDLHAALERFSGGNVDPQRALKALLQDSNVGFTGLLLDGRSADLQAGMEAILATQTRRRQLQDVLEAYRSKRAPDRSSPVFSKERPCGPQLLAALSRWGARPNVKEQRSDAAVCAHCFVALSTSAEINLTFHRVAECTSCRRLTVRLKP